MKNILRRLCGLILLCAVLAVPFTASAVVEVIGDHRQPGVNSVQYAYVESEEAFREWIVREGVYASKDRKPSRESTGLRPIVVDEPGELIFCPVAFSRRDSDHGVKAAFYLKLKSVTTGEEHSWRCLSRVQETQEFPRLRVEPGMYTYRITENDAHETAFLAVYVGFIPDSGRMRTDTVTEDARGKVLALADRLPELKLTPAAAADEAAFREAVAGGQAESERVLFEQKSRWYRFRVEAAGTLLISGGDGGLGSNLCVFQDPGYTWEVLRCACTKNPGENVGQLQVRPGTYYLYVLNLDKTGYVSLCIGLIPEAEAEESAFTVEATEEATEPVVTIEATEEAAEPVVTVEATEEPTVTAETTEEAAEPVFTVEATEEAAEPVFTVEATEEAAEPVFTIEATEEAAEPVVTVETTEEAAEEPAGSADLVAYIGMLRDIMGFYHLEIPEAGPDMTLSDLIGLYEAVLGAHGIILPSPLK
ncbi:MAG: hypothetical protein IKS31_03865 [Clostridia bacterium]|nr:hypothetical protein [Clostridia bacterium]